LIDAILLRPLPFPGEDRLIWVGELFNHSRGPGTVCYRTFAGEGALRWKAALID
jgi:hypothetical protein